MIDDRRPEAFGRRLRDLRLRRGLSLREAAELFAIPRSTLARWERGDGLGVVSAVHGLLEAYERSAGPRCAQERVPDLDHT